MDPEQQVCQLLGMARKSGNLSLGSEQTLEQIKAGKVFLVIVTEEAGYRTQKKFRDKCQYYRVPVLIWGKSEDVSRAVGKNHLSVLGINNEGFAAKIRTIIAV